MNHIHYLYTGTECPEVHLISKARQKIGCGTALGERVKQRQIYVMNRKQIFLKFEVSKTSRIDVMCSYQDNNNNNQHFLCTDFWLEIMGKMLYPLRLASKKHQGKSENFKVKEIFIRSLLSHACSERKYTISIWQFAFDMHPCDLWFRGSERNPSGKRKQDERNRCAKNSSDSMQKWRKYKRNVVDNLMRFSCRI